MKLNLKDEPKEWRKSALLLLGGLALLSGVLRWRHVLNGRMWVEILAIAAVFAVMAILRPRLFRGYHLFSMRAGFAISQVLGRVILTVIFVFFLTPLGILLRIAGKDPLQLRRPANSETYWQPAKDPGPLDRMF